MHVIPDEDPVCIFCEKTINTSEKNHEGRVQVVFDGWEPYGKGFVMKKRPGKVIYMHGVCGIPNHVEVNNGKEKS